MLVYWDRNGPALDSSGGGEKDGGHLAIGFKVKNKRHAI